MTRLTYKSIMGDYGSVMEYPSKNDEIQALRNRLGKYEDFEIPLENLKWISLLGNSCYVVRADVIIKCHVLAVKFDEFHRIYYYIAGNYKIDEEINLLKIYQKKVYDTISSYLENDEKEWLLAVCCNI